MSNDEWGFYSSLVPRDMVVGDPNLPVFATLKKETGLSAASGAHRKHASKPWSAMDPFRASTLEKIARFRCSIIKVLRTASEGGVDWAYSIGLDQRFGHPEILVTGILPPPSSPRDAQRLRRSCGQGPASRAGN
jgi:hypothetical protein